MASSPPLPPSPSLDDIFVPPIPPTVVSVPECGNADLDFVSDDGSLDIFPPIDLSSPLPYVPPPVPVQSPPLPIEFFFPETPDKCYFGSRGRSRSRSRTAPSRDPSASPPRCHSPIRACVNPIMVYPPSLYGSSHSRSCTPESLRSPSPPPRRRRYSYRSRTPSPIRRSYTYTPPQILYPPPPPPIVPLPNMTQPPPPIIPPFGYRPEPMPIPEPVDILTYHSNKNMAYAPAAKTYDVLCLCFFPPPSPPCHDVFCCVHIN